MNERVGPLWLHLSSSGEERLFRIQDMSVPGRLELSPYGEIQVQRNAKGNLVALPSEKDLICRFFADATPLRKRGLTLEAVRRIPPIRRRIVFAVAFTAISLVSAASIFARREASPEKADAIIATPISSPKPVAKMVKISTPIPRIVTTPTPIPKLEMKKESKQPDWFGVERRIREDFVRGEFARALSEISEFQVGRRSSVPKSLRSLSAEVNYAVGLQAYESKKWREAVRYLERAVKFSGHGRAQQILRELSEQSRKLYLEGYVMEKTNRSAALQRYREALASAPSKTEARAKASRKLKSFQDSRID